MANDIFRERVTLRGVDGELRIVPLAELREDVATFDPNAAWLRARPVDAEAPETGRAPIVTADAGTGIRAGR